MTDFTMFSIAKKKKQNQKPPPPSWMWQKANYPGNKKLSRKAILSHLH